MHSSIGKGQHLPLCCLVDIVDQLPDPSRECVLMEISFVAILVGYEEKLLVLALILRFGQVDLKSSDWTMSGPKRGRRPGITSFCRALLVQR